MGINDNSTSRLRGSYMMVPTQPMNKVGSLDAIIEDNFSPLSPLGTNSNHAPETVEKIQEIP